MAKMTPEQIEARQSRRNLRATVAIDIHELRNLKSMVAEVIVEMRDWDDEQHKAHALALSYVHRKLGHILTDQVELQRFLVERRS